MNAIEARELSEQNEISAVRNELLMVINEMESKIEQGAKGGYFQATLEISPSRTWMKFNATSEVRRHFANKGFGFKVATYFNNNELFICSW